MLLSCFIVSLNGRFLFYRTDQEFLLHLEIQADFVSNSCSLSMLFVHYVGASSEAYIQELVGGNVGTISTSSFSYVRPGKTTARGPHPALRTSFTDTSEFNHKQYKSSKHLSFLLLFWNLKFNCCFSLFVKISKLSMNFHWFNNSLFPYLTYKRQFHITYYKYLQSSGGHSRGEGVATLPKISEL